MITLSSETPSPFNGELGPSNLAFRGQHGVGWLLDLSRFQFYVGPQERSAPDGTSPRSLLMALCVLAQALKSIIIVFLKIKSSAAF